MNALKAKLEAAPSVAELKKAISGNNVLRVGTHICYHRFLEDRKGNLAKEAEYERNLVSIFETPPGFSNTFFLFTPGERDLENARRVFSENKSTFAPVSPIIYSWEGDIYDERCWETNTATGAISALEEKIKEPGPEAIMLFGINLDACVKKTKGNLESLLKRLGVEIPIAISRLLAKNTYELKSTCDADLRLEEAYRIAGKTQL